MKTTKERLLTFVLEDQNYTTFRKALLENALGSLRRRKWEQRRNRFLALAACFVALAGALLFKVAWPPFGTSGKTGLQIVRSTPLGQESVITTAGFMAALAPGREVGPVVVHAPVVWIRTAPSISEVEVLTDEQLLATFAGHPVGLIKTGEGRKQLWFLEPADEAVFVGSPAKEGLQ